MGLFTLVLGIGSFWACVHIYWSLTSTHLGHHELPISTNTYRRNAPRHKRLGHTTIQLHRLHLHVQSTSPREWFERLSRNLQRHERAKWRCRLIYIYDIGIVMCLLGMFIIICFLAWACIHMAVSIWHTFLSESAQTVQLAKRSSLPQSVGQMNVHPGFSRVLVPLIPGLTTPLSHLIPALLAVFASQIFHEAGHALCAAVESIPVLGVGAWLAVVLPAAFVNLESTTVNVLPVRGRLRIIAGGPFHNLLLWILLFMSSYVLAVLRPIFYVDISDLGVAIAQVESETPMSEILEPGILITKVEDQWSTHDVSLDWWMSYFATNPSIGADNQNAGWCIPDGIKSATSPQLGCCQLGDVAFPLTCFTAMENDLDKYCIDLSQLLASDHRRCSSFTDCRNNHTCLSLSEPTGFTILTVTSWNTYANAPSLNERRILWTGPRSELFDQLKVSAHVPRISVFPGWLLSVGELLFQYLLIANQSLFFFNLLPIFGLDGAQLLSAFVTSYTTTTASTYPEGRLEVIEDGISDHNHLATHNSRHAPWWTREMPRFIALTTYSLLTCAIGLEILGWAVQYTTTVNKT